MKKSVLLLILVLILPFAQAFFPFTGFAINVEEETPIFTCPDNYEKTGEFSCIPKCKTEKKDGITIIQMGNKKLYSYCFDSNILYEPSCTGLTIVYKKTICEEGCKDGSCQILEKCTDNTPLGSCSINLKSYCNKEKEITQCKESEICKSGVCISSTDCSKNNGFTAKGICPTGFKPIPSTLIKKEANIQCCIPLEQELLTLTIESTATCEDNTPIGKCSETKPYLCTHEKILIRDCAKCGCSLNEKCDVNDPMVCEKIQDITADFYETIEITEAEKPILYAPLRINMFNLPKQILPSYLLSPPLKDNEPIITHAHKTAEGLQIESGDSSFTITIKNGVPKIDFSF